MAEQEHLDEIKARRASASDLPWQYRSGGAVGHGYEGTVYVGDGYMPVADVYDDANGPFIAHAAADIDWLVGQLEKSWAMLREIGGMAEDARRRLLERGRAR